MLPSGSNVINSQSLQMSPLNSPIHLDVKPLFSRMSKMFTRRSKYFNVLFSSWQEEEVQLDRMPDTEVLAVTNYVREKAPFFLRVNLNYEKEGFLERPRSRRRKFYYFFLLLLSFRPLNYYIFALF